MIKLERSMTADIGLLSANMKIEIPKEIKFTLNSIDLLDIKM